MTAHEVLVEARNLLDREGLVQHDLGRAGDGFCLLGAIHEVNTGSSCGPLDLDGLDAYGVVVELVRPEAPYVWNNAAERTKEEVLALFDKAIAATAPDPDTDFLNEASWRTPEAVA